MARIRSVHPELFLDDAFMELSAYARLLAIGIWTQCDDHGIFEWKPNYLKATICPVDAVDVPHLLSELQEANCVKPFDDGGRRYGAVRNFCLYQRPKKPLFKHPFPDWCGSYVAVDRRKAQEEANQSAPKAPPVAPASPTSGENSPHRRVEERSGRVEEEPKANNESLERVPPAEQKRPPASPPDSLSDLKSVPKKAAGLAALGTALPETWTPDDATCGLVKSEYGMTDADIHSELLAFHSINASNGAFSANWSKSFVTFCKRWKEHRDKQAQPRVELNRGSPTRTPQQISETEWDDIVAFYARTGRWRRDSGPDPMSPACSAPRHILERHSINLETGERTIPPRKTVSA